jgi:ABC-type glycerol-3-phosphate transport system substrate-binding protein
MKFSRRHLLALAAAGLSASLVAAPLPAAADPPGEGKLVVWMFNQAVMERLQADFAKDYPGYEVEYVQLPAPDLVQRLVIALQGGQGLPDVVQLLARESGELFATGQFLDLSEDLAPVMDQFPEGILARNGDEIVAFQQATGNMGLWVNRAGLAEHGLEMPADGTWDDVLDVARQLKEKSGGTQYFLIQPPAANGFLMFNAYFNSRGGNWWDGDGKLAADRDLAVATLKFLVDARKEGLVYDTVWSDPAFWDLIRAKTILGYQMNYPVGSTNLQRNVPEQSGNWQLVTWPKWSADAEQRTGNFGGAVFAGLKGGANNEGARDLIMWWLTDAGLQAQYDLSGLVPYKRAAEVVERKPGSEYHGGQDVIADLESVTFPPFNFRKWSDTVSAGTNAVDSAMSGAKTPEQAIDDMLSELAAL